jgi:Predicted membrane protein
MKGATLIRRLGVTEADFSALREAVSSAERTTSGEIALAITPESSDYSFFELLFAVLAGALAFACLLSFAAPLSALLDRLSWHKPEWLVPAFYGAASFAVIGLLFLAANIPAVDRLVVPQAWRHRAVYRRALRHFVESGVYATADRTGILIFISWMEKEVRILADTGISTRIVQTEWDAIALTITRGIRSGNPTDALVDAVTACGKLLAEHFPPSAENPNEIADGLVVLEGGE